MNEIEFKVFVNDSWQVMAFQGLLFSGILDVNRKKVYEGDTIKAHVIEINKTFTGKVVFAEGYFGLKVESINERLPLYGLREIEILLE